MNRVSGDSELEDAYRSQLEQQAELLRAEGYKGPLPEVDQPERFIAPHEFPTVHSAWLRQQGFDVSPLPSGISAGDIPASDRAAFALARYVCWSKFPIDPRR